MGPGGLPSFMQQPPGSTTPASPAANADTSGTSLMSFGPGQPAANLAADTAFGNLQAAPNIDTLTKLVNDINSTAQQKLNASRLGPAGQAVQDTLLGNAAAGAQGQLTPSELRILQMSAAERGAGGGFGVDSPNISSDFMDRYLRTSYERQQDALKNYSTLLADNPSAPLYGAQNNLVTPGVYANTAAQQADLQYKYAALQAAINAGNQNRAMNRGAAPTTTTAPPAPSAFPTFTPAPGPSYVPDYSNAPGVNYDPYYDLPGYEVPAPGTPSSSFSSLFPSGAEPQQGVTDWQYWDSGSYQPQDPIDTIYSDLGFGDYYGG